MCGAERLYGPEHGRRYAIEFSAAVLLYGAAWTAVVVEVGKQPVNPSARMAEFEQLVKRTKSAGLGVLIDFVPNHVAREYHSDAA